MVLAVHNNASYLSEPRARSCADGHFFLSYNSNNPPNNGTVINIDVINNRSRIGSIIRMVQEAVYIRIILKELGHRQTPTPIQTDRMKQWSMEKYSPNAPEQSTWDSPGYETENVKINSKYIGNQVKQT